jgi:hypothetical protein
MIDKRLTTYPLAQFSGIHYSTLDNWRRSGELPPPAVPGGRGHGNGCVWSVQQAVALCIAGAAYKSFRGANPHYVAALVRRLGAWSDEDLIGWLCNCQDMYQEERAAAVNAASPPWQPLDEELEVLLEGFRNVKRLFDFLGLPFGYDLGDDGRGDRGDGGGGGRGDGGGREQAHPPSSPGSGRMRAPAPPVNPVKPVKPVEPVTPPARVVQPQKVIGKLGEAKGVKGKSRSRGGKG